LFFVDFLRDSTWWNDMELFFISTVGVFKHGIAVKKTSHFLGFNHELSGEVKS